MTTASSVSASPSNGNRAQARSPSQSQSQPAAAVGVMAPSATVGSSGADTSSSSATGGPNVKYLAGSNFLHVSAAYPPPPVARDQVHCSNKTDAWVGGWLCCAVLCCVVLCCAVVVSALASELSGPISSNWLVGPSTASHLTSHASRLPSSTWWGFLHSHRCSSSSPSKCQTRVSTLTMVQKPAAAMAAAVVAAVAAGAAAVPAVAQAPLRRSILTSR